MHGDLRRVLVLFSAGVEKGRGAQEEETRLRMSATCRGADKKQGHLPALGGQFYRRSRFRCVHSIHCPEYFLLFPRSSPDSLNPLFLLGGGLWLENA